MPEPKYREGYEGNRVETHTLKGEEASRWLEDRGLYNPATQSAPKEIIVVHLDKALSDILNDGSKTISVVDISRILNEHSLSIDLSFADGSLDLHVGIKTASKKGDGSMEIVFSVNY